MAKFEEYKPVLTLPNGDLDEKTLPVPPEVENHADRLCDGLIGLGVTGAIALAILAATNTAGLAGIAAWELTHDGPNVVTEWIIGGERH